MGITIAFQGKLADTATVLQLTEDISQLCSAMGWPVLHAQTVVSEGIGKPTSTSLRGLSLHTHPQCEWLHLHVAPDGRFVNHFYWSMLEDTEHARKIMDLLRENEREVSTMMKEGSARKPSFSAESNSRGLTMHKVDLAPQNLDLKAGATYNWVKTQQGGVEAHVAVCGVLARVKEKYAPDLHVNDDTGYFRHGRLKQLEKAMAEVDYLLLRVRNAVGKIASDDSASPRNVDELIEKIERSLGTDRDTLH